MWQDEKPQARLTFGFDKKLKSRKSIDRLFKNGRSLSAFPLSLKYLGISEEDSYKILVAVPKKLHKRAVDRNKIKRRIREAFRIHFRDYLTSSSGCHLAIIYKSPEIVSFDEIQGKLITLLQRLGKKCD